jgi:kynurenine formamidase
LSEVEAGIYHFSALPLKIAGGDAGPVRAILWRD